MTKSDRPNMLVMWGDDIGISNLSYYSDGRMGYETPNIDRVRPGSSSLATGVSRWGCFCRRIGSTVATRTRRSSSYSTTPSQRTPRESIWRSTSRSGSEKELNVVMFPPRQSCVLCRV
jgi:hypothetical protein